MIKFHFEGTVEELKSLLNSGLLVEKSVPTQTESKMTVDEHGHKTWRNSKGELHRDGDLPAIELTDGSEFWYKNGQLHRDNDLPAIKWADGTQFWYVNNKCHRDGDLPAAERADGRKEWWVNGVQYTPKKKRSRKK